MRKKEEQHYDDKETVEEANSNVETLSTEDNVTPLIYCGPNVFKASLVQSTVFTNGLPKQAQYHVEECPAIKQLLVPVEKYAETLANINTLGTAENVFYNQILQYIAKGVAE